MIRTFKGTSQDQPFSHEVVIVDTNGRTARLPPERSQAVKNHSPDGFNWGYWGSGNEAVALAYYQDFEARFIATIDSQHINWEISEHEIIG